MPNGGTLHIDTSVVNVERPYLQMPPGRYVRLSVSDTGTGIAPEVLAHIFEPFFTTFTIYFRPAPGVEKVESAPVREADASLGGDERVLVVDDEPGVRKLLAVFSACEVMTSSRPRTRRPRSPSSAAPIGRWIWL